MDSLRESIKNDYERLLELENKNNHKQNIIDEDLFYGSVHLILISLL
jgi:hypothetical protein